MTTTVERKPRTHTAKGRPFKHGRGGYVNHKCGCEVCVEANRAYLRKTWHHREENGGARTLLALECAECGAAFQARRGQKFCSYRCMGESTHTVKGLTQLVRGGEWDQVMARLLEVTVQVGDCLEWAGTIKGGYPSVTVDDRSVLVHRLMLQAKHGGRPLGVLHGHHVCANTRCVNPDHLQPVTAAENNAEMMARQSYLARIQELEEAIREMSPDHEVLHRVPVDGSTP